MFAVIALLLLAAIPISLSLWALLDAAHRPAWAWSLAGKSQLGWLLGIAVGVLLLVAGVGIALWYLVLIRPAVRAVEHGDFSEVAEPLE